MRSMFRTVFVAMLAVLALSAVVASAAQAAEGPFFKVAGARLKEGESKELTGKLSSHEVVISFPGSDISCTTMDFAAGAKIAGSTGANFGFGEGVLELSKCVGEGPLTAGCEVTGFKSKPLKEELAFLSSERSGELGVDFTPVSTKPASGDFGEIKLVGTCSIKSIKLEGSIVADVGKDEVGKEPAEAKGLLLKLPTVGIRKAWLEKSGSLTEVRPELQWQTGEALAMSGEFSLELASGAEWGVFTK